MDDLSREKRKGLSLWYLKDVLLKRRLFGRKHQTPGFGLAAQLFSVMAKHVIEKLGEKEGGELVGKAVEEFGRERGRRIAELVASMGKPLSFKNWLIYTDIDGRNFPVRPRIESGDLVAPVGACSFHRAAAKWGLEGYTRHYCEHADFAILDGYNPDIRLTLEQRHRSGKDHCLFRYSMKK